MPGELEAGDDQEAVHLRDAGGKNAPHTAQPALHPTGLATGHQHQLGAHLGLQLVGHAAPDHHAARVAFLQPSPRFDPRPQGLRVGIAGNLDALQAYAQGVVGSGGERLQEDARRDFGVQMDQGRVRQQGFPIPQEALIGRCGQVSLGLNGQVALAHADGVADHLVVSAVSQADGDHCQAEADGDGTGRDRRAPPAAPQVAPGQRRQSARGQRAVTGPHECITSAGR